MHWAGFTSCAAGLRDLYLRQPGQHRRVARSAVTMSAERSEMVDVEVRLPFTAPYDWAAMLGFLAVRAIPGVEHVRDNRYTRTFALERACGTVAVCAVNGESHLLARITSSNADAVADLTLRLRRVFDLDADGAAIDRHLARDAVLCPLVLARPGIRVPGAWDAFELAARAVLGQQITVRAATTFAGRIAAAYGEPLDATSGAEGTPHLIFPTAARIARADFTGIGLTRARATTLRDLGAAVHADPQLLHACKTLEDTVTKLTQLPGIGPWTAQYIAMRALREPDAFPASDLGLLRAFATAAGRPTPQRLLEIAAPWRPWRAYAAIRVWLQSELLTMEGPL